MKKFLFLILSIALFSCKSEKEKTVEFLGEAKVWHTITFEFNGPKCSEWDKENPFLDYRLEMTFKKGERTIKVPGFFAADGNAAETSADSGNSWKVNFCPDEPGMWEGKVSFRKGKDIAISEVEDEGESVGVDGKAVKIEIEDSDKTGDDFRAKGRIINGYKGHFKFQGTDELWIKNGADSPENFLAYEGFDQTLRYGTKAVIREGEADPKKALHNYEPHIADWKEGDPTWQNGKGKGIIGALNYLQSAGINSQYMLTMNIMGDGKDVWPYIDHNERYRFDCSKLDQWEIVFEHMDKLGMMVHFVLQETENECLLDAGYTDVQRKLYLRELVARFGHHLGVTWNIGEENGPADWTPIGQTDQQKKDMMRYLKKINPYPSNVVLHTHADDYHQDTYLTPMLGFENIDGPSMQVGDLLRVHERIKKWVAESEKVGRSWLVNLDEIGPAWKGVMPDSFDEKHDTIRNYCLWGTLLAGGSGVEWYCGYRYPNNDLNLEDFRSRENWWKQSTIATQFIGQFPLEEMVSSDDLVNIKEAYCLAKPGDLYVVYLPAGTKNPSLKLDGNKSYSVKWLNPRDGGELQTGSIQSIEGSGWQRLGEPPADTEMDWVVLIQ